MLKPMLFALLLPLTSFSLAEPTDSKHYYITDKIAEYTLAFDRCNKIAEGRGLPDEHIIDSLAEFPQSEIEPLLMSKAVLVRQQCEKPELTELAYAILVTDNEALQPKTSQAISAIKILAFSSDILKFEAVYQSVSVGVRESLEEIGYFDQPFDDRRILEAVREKR